MYKLCMVFNSKFSKIYNNFIRILKMFEISFSLNTDSKPDEQKQNTGSVTH